MSLNIFFSERIVTVWNNRKCSIIDFSNIKLLRCLYFCVTCPNMHIFNLVLLCITVLCFALYLILCRLNMLATSGPMLLGLLQINKFSMQLSVPVPCRCTARLLVDIHINV